jgi:hypothetical protein
MTQLTPSGEVAVFLDDDQFHAGESVDKCGPEAVSLFWHSVKPGEQNPYTSAQIHAMAHDDYVRFIGPDVASNHGGTSNQLLYTMLASHRFSYKPGPADIHWVQSWLKAGYPVIIGIWEESVHDLALGGNPYNWETRGLTHIIVASGPGTTGEVLVRDTANIGPQGVRPGPRRYDTTKLQLVSATMVVPSWLDDPASASPPPPPIDYLKMAKDAYATLGTAIQHLHQ